MKKNNLTLRYSLHQASYWAAIGGVVTFAATYLLSKGFTAAQTGIILCCAYLASFLLQPIVASYADRAGRNIIPSIMLLFSFLSIACFLAVRFLSLPMIIFAVMYTLGIMLLDMQIPLLNALSVYYTSHSWALNYGLGRGVGGFGYAIATLIYGYIMEDFGTDIMLIVAISLIAVYCAITVTYPKTDSVSSAETRKDASSLIEFFGRNRWYCLSLFGILFLAMYHTMTENYLINILGRLGGDSSNVGVALFVATLTELPAMTVFAAVYRKLGSYRLLVISGVSFFLKAFLFVVARSVTAIYFIQVLQVVTYVPLSTVQMFYANDCTDVKDMIKGQSVITAFYTLGSAVGNLTGGSLITRCGVPVLLYTGVAVTVLGTTVLLLTVPKALQKKS